MDTAQHFATEYWEETESSVEFVPANSAPALPVTAVKIYAIQDDKMLFANVGGRGWDTPGGHVEPGETPEEALVRELREETGATAKQYGLIGYLKITNVKENDRNKHYPKESCILIYSGKGLEFDADYDLSKFESTEQRLISFSQIHDFHHNWTDMKQQILEYVTRKSTAAI